MEFLSEYGMFLAKAATIVVALLGVGWSSGCLAPTLQRGSKSRRSSVPRDLAETNRWSGSDGIPTLERGNEKLASSGSYARASSFGSCRC